MALLGGLPLIKTLPPEPETRSNTTLPAGSYLSMKSRSGFLSRRLGYSVWVVSMASPILPDNTSFWISAEKRQRRQTAVHQTSLFTTHTVTYCPQTCEVRMRSE